MYSIKRIFYGILAVIITLNLVNYALSDTNHSGTIAGTQDWYSNQNNHIITGNIIVTGTLVIHQSCYVKFNGDYKIEVRDGGHLFVDGNPGYWVTMVGNNGTTWSGLTVEQAWANIAQFKVEYCNIWNAYRGVNIAGNTYGNIELTSLYVYAGSYEGIRIGLHDGNWLDGNVTISDCYVYNRQPYGIFVKALGNVTIYNNSVSTCTGGAGYGIFTEACPSATITDNFVQSCKQGIHAWDGSPSGTYVGSNDIVNCTQIGIWRGRGSNSTASNEIHNCPEGIHTDDHAGTVEDNYIYVPSGGKGIYLNTGSTSELYHNTISWEQSGTNGGYGIHGGQVGVGVNPRIWGNYIYHVNTGIYLGPNVSSSSKTRWNEIAYCGIAIDIVTCSPDLGTQNQNDYGNNNVHDITNYFIRADQPTSTIRAEMNWWGADPPPDRFNKFSGNIDYTPWRTSAP